MKSKAWDSLLFTQILDKEQQRITQENQCLYKQQTRIEDKALVKNLQKMVKKMLKPFKGL